MSSSWCVPFTLILGERFDQWNTSEPDVDIMNVWRDITKLHLFSCFLPPPGGWYVAKETFLIPKTHRSESQGTHRNQHITLARNDNYCNDQLKCGYFFTTVKPTLTSWMYFIFFFAIATALELARCPTMFTFYPEKKKNYVHLWQMSSWLFNFLTFEYLIVNACSALEWFVVIKKCYLIENHSHRNKHLKHCFNVIVCRFYFWCSLLPQKGCPFFGNDKPHYYLC